MPEWLDGLYVRNAPALHSYGSRNFTHLFDAFSKLHAWRFNGTVTISARFTPSEEWNKTLERGSITPVRLLGGVTPAWNASEWAESLLAFPDNAGINVWRYGSRNEPRLASTTDEMVFQGFDWSPDAGYAGPLRFLPPTASPEQFEPTYSTQHTPVPRTNLRAGRTSAPNAPESAKSARQQPVLSPSSADARAKVLAGIADASGLLDGFSSTVTTPMGEKDLASAARLDGSKLAALPPTSVLSTAHPHYDVQDDSISYNVAGVVNPLAIIDPEEHHSIALYKTDASLTATAIA